MLNKSTRWSPLLANCSREEQQLDRCALFFWKYVASQCCATGSVNNQRDRQTDTDRLRTKWTRLLGMKIDWQASGATWTKRSKIVMASESTKIFRNSAIFDIVRTVQLWVQLSINLKKFNTAYCAFSTVCVIFDFFLCLSARLRHVSEANPPNFLRKSCPCTASLCSTTASRDHEDRAETACWPLTVGDGVWENVMFHTVHSISENCASWKCCSKSLESLSLRRSACWPILLRSVANNLVANFLELPTFLECPYSPRIWSMQPY